MAQLPEIRGRFSVAASAHQINVGVNALTMNAGNYYTVGVAGESNAYIDDVQIQLRTIGGQANSLVNYYPANGGCVITLNTAAAINMGGLTSQALGFSSGTLASATVFGGDQIPQHIWRPTRGLSDHPVEVNVLWAPRSSTVVGRSVDGTTFSREGNTLDDAEVSFNKLPRADVMKPDSGTIGRDLQSFFVDVVMAGEPVRWLPRRESPDLSMDALIGSEDDDEIGSWSDYYSRHVDPWFSLFGVTLPLIKKV
jgi:hypothetical protein